MSDGFDFETHVDLMHNSCGWQPWQIADSWDKSLDEICNILDIDATKYKSEHSARVEKREKERREGIEAIAWKNKRERERRQREFKETFPNKPVDLGEPSDGHGDFLKRYYEYRNRAISEVPSHRHEVAIRLFDLLAQNGHNENIVAAALVYTLNFLEGGGVVNQVDVADNYNTTTNSIRKTSDKIWFAMRVEWPSGYVVDC